MEKETWTDAQRELLEPIDRRGWLFNVHKTLANHPKLLADWLPFGTYVLKDNTLPARERELVILRIGYLCGSAYELAQHAAIGRRAGLTTEEVERVAEGPQAAGWSEIDRLLLEAVDQLHADAFIGDDTWRQLSQTYNPRQLMDLVFTVGEYNLVSMALNSFGVQLDDGLPPFPG